MFDDLIFEYERVRRDGRTRWIWILWEEVEDGLYLEIARSIEHYPTENKTRKAARLLIRKIYSAEV